MRKKKIYKKSMMNLMMIVNTFGPTPNSKAKMNILKTSSEACSLLKNNGARIQYKIQKKTRRIIREVSE